MRSAILLSAALAFCASAQNKPALRPGAKPGLVETSPATPSAEKEPKGARSELSNPGAAQRLSTLPSHYQFLITEAMRRFQLRDFKGAIAYLDRADEVLPPTGRSLNVRGAIAIEQREFERGHKYCSDALKVDPGYFPAKFNICEIPFIEGKYAEARELWLKLFNSGKWGDFTSELLIYRIFLTYLIEKDFDHAKDWMDKIPFPSRTPAYQYANAAWARQKGDLAKWDDWIRSAAYIWPQTTCSEFMDVLVHLGWLKWK